MHRWVSIKVPQDYDKIAKDLPRDFALPVVVERLKSHLSEQVRGVLVEYPYVDKDYRSTYYGFYAKKGKRYDPFCVRLHFFGEGVKLTPNLSLENAKGDWSKNYFGFMVVRPIENAPIGRSVLSVNAVKAFSGQVIKSWNVAHVLGERLVVRGFPFMQQHTDISVCAHAACWGILRYYSSRFKEYAERSVFDITKMASREDPGGLAPSRGLKVEDASLVFSRAGLFPDAYSISEWKDSLHRLLVAYVDSGFPVFAAMNAKAHAISVIGHGDPDRTSLKPKKRAQFAWDAIQSLHVIDDTLMPYQKLTATGGPYSYTEIDSFIVPLPEKIYFPAEMVETHVLHLLANPRKYLDLSYIKSPVVRYFITTASTFRQYLKDNRSQFPDPLYEALMDLVLPQFVWFVELASLTEWKKGRFNSLALIDATASPDEVLPFFLLMDQSRAVIFDRARTNALTLVDLKKYPLIPMSEFHLNLQPRN